MSEVAEKSFVCGCGYSTTTKSGLTNHQKVCANRSVPAGVDVQGEKPAPPPSLPGEPKSALAAFVGGNDKLSSTDRNQFAKRITERRDAMLEALSNELSGDANIIEEKMRQEAGLSLSVDQINELIEGVEQTIETEIEQHLKDKEEEIKAKEADLEEEYRIKEEEMRERHKQEYTAMRREQKAKKTEYARQLKEAKDQVIKEKTPELVRKKQELQGKLIVTRQAEQELTLAVQQRAVLLRRSKERLSQVIRDAANRALEQLLVVNTRKEAGDLINSIPTIGEAVTLCSSPEGFSQLFRRLDSTMALPAPTDLDKKFKDAQAKVVSGEIEVSDEDDEDEDEDDEDEDDDKETDEDDEESDAAQHAAAVYVDEDAERERRRRERERAAARFR